MFRLTSIHSLWGSLISWWKKINFVFDKKIVGQKVSAKFLPDNWVMPIFIPFAPRAIKWISSSKNLVSKRAATVSCNYNYPAQSFFSFLSGLISNPAQFKMCKSYFYARWHLTQLNRYSVSLFQSRTMSVRFGSDSKLVDASNFWKNFFSKQLL